MSTFYKFFPFEDYFHHRNALKAHFAENGVLGIVLIAAEGINGTISGTREAIDAL